MPTHGRARDTTIADLAARRPFNRKGFGMSAVAGPVALPNAVPDWERAGSHRLPASWVDQYRADRATGITYTVMSYRTPILWVLADGTIRRPDVCYSITTTNHQGMAAVYVR